MIILSDVNKKQIKKENDIKSNKSIGTESKSNNSANPFKK